MACSDFYFTQYSDVYIRKVLIVADWSKNRSERKNKAKGITLLMFTNIQTTST